MHLNNLYIWYSASILGSCFFFESLNCQVEVVLSIKTGWLVALNSCYPSVKMSCGNIIQYHPFSSMIFPLVRFHLQGIYHCYNVGPPSDVNVGL